ncbi:MAG: TetR/AcrR family transcriptional regulator [Myxococcota bacterium]|jgi:AcrR family transcriptional regulator|nr:TetR/AcrR family transcriptional regulator [Myxococcota bacterium]
MPRPRFEKLAPERREALIVAAGHSFARDGYSGASLNQIITECGLSKGAFYYYFDDKADLFVSVVRWAMKLVMRNFEHGFEPPDAEAFWQGLFELNASGFRWVQENRWVVELSKELKNPPNDPALMKHLAPLLEEMNALLRRAIALGQRLGAVRDDLPQDLLLSLMLAIDHASDTWIFARWDELGPEKLQALSEKLLQMTRRMFEAPPSPTKQTEGERE